MHLRLSLVTQCPSLTIAPRTHHRRSPLVVKRRHRNRPMTNRLRNRARRSERNLQREVEVEVEAGGEEAEVEDDQDRGQAGEEKDLAHVQDQEDPVNHVREALHQPNPNGQRTTRLTKHVLVRIPPLLRGLDHDDQDRAPHDPKIFLFPTTCQERLLNNHMPSLERATLRNRRLRALRRSCFPEALQRSLCPRPHKLRAPKRQRTTSATNL